MEQDLTPTKRLVQMSHGLPVEALLRGYHDLGWTQGEIADQLGVSRKTVISWFRQYGIRTKRGGRRRP